MSRPSYYLMTPLLATCLVCVIRPVTRAQSTAQSTPAQDAAVAALPTFEVASIKPNNSGWGGMNGSFGPISSHWSATNVTPKWLIEDAFRMDDFQITGMPAWANSKRYDIEADIDESVVQQLRKLSVDEQHAQVQLMVQSLLADRFQLKVTHESKDLPAYNLVLLKDDAKLKAFKVDSFPANPAGLVMMSIGRNGQVTMEMTKASVTVLGNGLTRLLEMPVMDQTGVAGNYSFKLLWTDERQLPAGATPDPDFDRTLAATLQEQLGIKLEQTKAARDTITIDHIEEPTPN